MKRAIFVTGTDTGIGKTIVTGLLAKSLLKKGGSVITQKWIQTGSKGLSDDIKTHLKIMGKDKNYIKDYLNDVCPYSFKFGASPHLASRLEAKRIDKNVIKKSFKLLSKRFDYVIVEGAGGVSVPYNQNTFLIDIAKELKMEVLLVVGNKLGAINHALLAYEALKKRGMNILGIYFNNLPGTNKIILRDNIKIIKKFTGAKVLNIENLK